MNEDGIPRDAWNSREKNYKGLIHKFPMSFAYASPVISVIFHFAGESK